MTLQEFEKQLREKSVTKDSTYTYVENCRRRSDGTWVLDELLKALNITGHSKSYKTAMINAIVATERTKQLFTKEVEAVNISKNAPKAKDSDELIVTCNKDNTFQPYEVTFKINNYKVDKKFKELLAQAKQEFCSDADWLLDPILEAIGYNE